MQLPFSPAEKAVEAAVFLVSAIVQTRPLLPIFLHAEPPPSPMALTSSLSF